MARCADLYIRHCLNKLYLQEWQIRQAGECTCGQFCYIICSKISKTYKLILRWVFWRQKLPTLREHLRSPLVRLYFQLFVGCSCLITLFVFVYAKWCPTHSVLCFSSHSVTYVSGYSRLSILIALLYSETFICTWFKYPSFSIRSLPSKIHYVCMAKQINNPPLEDNK
jgi:hypothetical protein